MTVNDLLNTLLEGVRKGTISATAPVLMPDGLDTYAILDSQTDTVYITDVDPNEVPENGSDPATVALRECVMDMVMLVNAMHRIVGNQPFTPAMLDAALTRTQDLRTSLEALRTHAKA